MDIDKYIHNHRSQFDQIESFESNVIWQQIELRRKHRSRISVLAVAASILILVAFTAGYFWTPQIALPDTRMELAFESSYQQSIEQKWSELEAQVSYDQQPQQAILDEIEYVDEAFEILKWDLLSVDDKTRVVELIKKEYERKLKLLDLLDKEIKNNKHESTIIY